MELFDPRLAVLAAGVAAVGSERVRRTVGKGIGYAATGAVTVGGPIVRPVVNAGREIVQEAREVASGNSSAKPRASRSKAGS